MSKIVVDTMRGVASIGGELFPMYAGFLSAEKIAQVAVVPNFQRTKEHHQIATDIATPPIDEWQRPLDNDKVNKVRDTYSDLSGAFKNLMANPVLLGIAPTKIDETTRVNITQKTVPAPGGAIAVDNVFSLTITYSDDKKPLWILDGQHRVEGLKASVQRDEPIPFVLLYEEGRYTAPFLAKIFTHVTTGATPMEPLHAEWMRYSFELPPYDNAFAKNAMRAVIELCKASSLGDGVNPLQNKIQFNPYVQKPGYFAFAFTCAEWMEIVRDNYYARGGPLGPEEVAAEIAKGIRVLERNDARRGMNSRFFSNAAHTILAEGFLSGFLKYVASNGPKTEAEWESFFLSPPRDFGRCDWSLPFVRSGGAMSSTFGPLSKQIAQECFDVAFNDPSYLGGNLLTDFLEGVGAEVRIFAYQKTAAGRLSNRNPNQLDFRPGAGMVPFHLNQGGTVRDIVRLEPKTVNCRILWVGDMRVVPAKDLKKATTAQGLDVSSFASGKEIVVRTMSYSGDTQRETVIRLDR